MQGRNSLAILTHQQSRPWKHCASQQDRGATATGGLAYGERIANKRKDKRKTKVKIKCHY